MHPIVEQMQPSEEQRPAVLARDCDVAVTAGAGAGKTRTLVARYLSLLADDIPLHTVAAITFTTKAAREMRNRVRQEIRQYLWRDDLTDAERRRWAERYEQLDAARIGTIHSLCAEILRHHPAAAGIDPRFGMLEEGEMALLQVQAVDAALGWAADNADSVAIFSDYNEPNLRGLIASMLGKRLDVADAQAHFPDDLWLLWEPVLVEPIRAFLQDASVQADLRDLISLRADGSLTRAAAAGDALVPDLTEALTHIDTIATAQAAGDWAEVSRHLAPLRSHLLLKGRQANWDTVSPKETIRRLREQYDARLEDLVKKGIDLDLDRRVAREVVPALLRFYVRAAETYTHVKQQLRALDFDDLEAIAVQLLEEDADARAYWQQEVQALLVDEFQDTNGRQRDLLRALSGAGHKLFVVGDGKQSIYRFRGADVTVFRAERQAIEADGTGLQLATSYRAHRGLIHCLNTLLRPVLGDAEDPERPYVEPFSELAPYRDAPAGGLQPPYVELHLAVGSKSDGALDRAAQVLSARLAELVEAGGITLEVEDEESGGRTSRLLNYGDIAILCRASTAFPAYENALEAAGIPYLTIAGRGFYDRPEVRDLVNALGALADPTDDLALAGLLRSPALGLSDMALYRLREVQGVEERTSLWETLMKGDLASLEDEVEEARHATVLIHELNRMVGRTPVADVLKAFLDRTAYRAIYLRAGESRSANNVSKLLADAHVSGILSVDTFVAYITQLRDVAPREGEARALTAGAVQIMTVHQAKGLEFPVVVLGDASRGSFNPGGFLIDASLGIVPPFTEDRAGIAPDGSREVKSVSLAAYRLAQSHEQDQEAAESDRLLYVAVTRARELLIINGVLSANKSGKIGVSGWLERLDGALRLVDTAPDCDGGGNAVHQFALNLDDQPVHCAIYESEALLPAAGVAIAAQPVQAVPRDLRLFEAVDGRRAHADEATADAERDPPRRVWRVVPDAGRAAAPAWVVGDVVHLALKEWSFPDGHRGDFYRWAAAEARNAGLTDEDRIRDALQRAARMLTRFQSTDLYARMSAADERLSEVPYSVLDDAGRLDSGVIDALWRAEGRWYLVELKTDRVKGGADLEQLLRETDYMSQVARYVAATERLLGQRPEPMLCFLNFAGRVRVVTDRWGRAL